MLLAKRHTAFVKVVISKDATQEEKHAAHELRQFLREVSDTSFPLMDCSEPMNGSEIILSSSTSHNTHIDELNTNINYNTLNNEGYLIKTINGSIIIASNKPRGLMYGIYGFLEDYIGIRFYTKDFTYIPKRLKLEVYDEINDIQNPVLEYREPWYVQNLDPDWHVRNKCNSSSANLNIMHGGKIKYVGFVHTFNSLVPVEEYFDSHPEYFSMIDGKRFRGESSGRTQLCLTNEDVLELTVKKIYQWLYINPDTSIISVSQNDWLNSCECPNCAAIDDAEGSKSGSLLYFVNKVAEKIEKDFPNVIIDTLAYQYTRKAPKNIKPRSNVVVRLCSIECCFAHPLSECDVMPTGFNLSYKIDNSFANDLREWGKISKRLHIWDYVTNYFSYLAPYPNFKVLKENINFFIENNVTGIFEEGNTRGGAAVELNHLRQYLLAKLMWNPKLDVDRIVNEFFSIYFGGAAQAMREYFDLIHAQITSDTHIGIVDLPTREYYSESMISQAYTLFKRAEMLANDDVILHRVKLCKLSIDYLKMVKMEFGSKERNDAIDRIIDSVIYYGVDSIHHNYADLEEYRNILKNERFLKIHS